MAAAAAPQPEMAPPVAGSRRTFANLAHIVGGEALLRIANLGAAVVIARHSGVAVFGVYATALAYSTVGAMITDNGLQVAAIKMLSGSPGRIKDASCELYAAKTFLVLPMLVITAAIAYGVHLSAFAWAIVALTMLRVVAQTYCQLQIAMLKGLDRMNVVGPIKGAHFVLLCIGLLYAYWGTTGIFPALIILLAGQLLEYLLEAIVLWRAGFRPRQVNLRNCLGLLRSFTGVGMSFNIANGIMRLDVISLSLVASTVAVGQFAAAQTAILVLYPVSWLFGSVLLPEMTRLDHDYDALSHYVRHWERLIAVVAIPCTILGMLVGPMILRTMFGTSFAASGRVLAIVLLAAPFIFWNSLYVNHAFALNRPKFYLGIYVFILVLTFVLDFSFGFIWAATGIAIAVVIREVAMAAGFTISSSRAGVQVRCD
jgi:O-antigen/teichoic acid export membrane protein